MTPKDAAPLSEDEIQEIDARWSAATKDDYPCIAANCSCPDCEFDRHSRQDIPRLIATIAVKDAEISKLRMERTLSSHHQGPAGSPE